MARDRSLALKLRAIDKMSATIDRVRKKFPGLSRSIRRSSRVVKIFNAQTKQMRATLRKVGGGMRRFGLAMTLGLTLPMAAAAAQGVVLFGDFQQGLRGIEKTTGLARKEVAKLGAVFDQLSTEIPVTTGEMLALAKAGGQLGIKGVKNIEKFTVVMAKMSRASDVAGEDGAKAIARILTVTGDGISEVERFSSALVDLGNNAAAGENEILEIATRVAGATTRFKVGSAQVLGMSTALRALGKRAEASGSVIGRAFDKIDQAIRAGGKQTQRLSIITGIAAKDLKKQFQTDSTKVFQKFVEGLNKVQEGGGNVVKVMGAFGLEGVRINDVLGTLVSKPEKLAENLKRSAKAFKENTALEKEFRIQTQSFNSEMIILKNTFSSLLRLIGQELAPVVSFFGGILKGIFNFLRNNPTIRALAIVFGILAAAIGPVLVLLGALLISLPPLIITVIALDIALLPIIGTTLAIAAGISALIVISVVLFKKWDAIKTFFNENPFGKFLKFVFLVLSPLGLMITAVRLLSAAMSDMGSVSDVLKDTFSFFGFETSDEEKKRKKRLSTNRFQNLSGKGPLRPEVGAKVGFFGPEIGARSASLGGGAGLPGKGNEVKGRIEILFPNAPEGTKVKSRTEGPLTFDLGFAGGIQ